jgi:hypothetical protein
MDDTCAKGRFQLKLFALFRTFDLGGSLFRCFDHGVVAVSFLLVEVKVRFCASTSESCAP